MARKIYKNAHAWSHKMYSVRLPHMSVFQDSGNKKIKNDLNKKYLAF